MNLPAIPAINNEEKTNNFIKETPAGSPDKYAYDKYPQLFKVKKILPPGSAFPFDFGFGPTQFGGDRDPLDEMVIADNHFFPGCLLSCRLLGVLEA